MGEIYNPFEESIKKIKENLPATMSKVAEIFNEYSIPAQRIKDTFDKIRPLLDSIVSLSAIHKTADKLADQQFVLVERIPKGLIDQIDNKDTDELIGKYFTSDDQVSITASKCGIEDRFRCKIKHISL